MSDNLTAFGFVVVPTRQAVVYDITWALHWGFIILGAGLLIVAVYRVGFREKMRREGKIKKGKGWIYDS